MSKTYKQQPKQPKPIRTATQRSKREKQKALLGAAQSEPVREWKSALEWRLGKDD